MPASTLTERLFTRIVARRIPILVAYGLLLPVAVALALRIPSDATIDNLLVSSDPDLVATRAFEKIFPDQPMVVLLFEAADPWRPELLARLQKVEDALGKAGPPRLSVVSAAGIYRRAHPEYLPDASGAEAFKRFASSTPLFRQQGLVGDRFQGLVVVLDVKGEAERDAALANIDAVLAGARGPEISNVRRVGAPYVESWIEQESGTASLKFFPVFGVFVVGIALFLYRSVRSLLAIILALGTSVALAMAAGKLLGFSFTVVSALVPLTVLVTALASLVYLHSRFVDQPDDVSVDDHQIFALANKFLPVTASNLAAVVGFAALAVSRIRPIRTMGIWTAVGLAFTWAVSFTLFPALQKVLRTPTGRRVAIRTRLYDKVAGALPGFTRRFRFVLLSIALVLAASGAVALFGLPGRISPMKLGIDPLDYVDPSLPIHRDMAFFLKHVSGLEVARVWVRSPAGDLASTEVLRGLDRFATAAEQLPDVSSVVGPTTFLRMRRGLAGQAGDLPQDAESFARATADFEQLLLSEPELWGFIDPGTLGNAQVIITFRDSGDRAHERLATAVRAAWARTVAADPAFAHVTMSVVGTAMVQAKIGNGLIQTFVESFALTAGLIFLAFLFVFRSPSARLMAMIPSVVAILVTFLGMRIFGATLNLATILIATAVLGTTENDQIHFFHHLQEKKADDLDAGLRHTLRVSGRAILFATLINSAGFMGLALSSFPPLRQFGIITSAAFLLAMLADFTALPAALWIGRRRGNAPKPDPNR